MPGTIGSYSNVSLIIMHVENDKDLSTFNTLAVPCIAKHYVTVATEEALREALIWAKSKAVATVFLGGGSNVILPEQLHALVIQPQFKGFTATPNGNNVNVRLGAGENWHTSVSRCVNEGYYGIENLALIPGSCGAAPIQNIGAYGVELNDVLESVEVFDTHTQRTAILPASACFLSYRDSLFKSIEPQRYVVMYINLRLSLTEAPVLKYPALKQHLAEQGLASPSPADVLKAVVAIRSSKLPDPAIVPNAGSFFKNPVVDASVATALSQRYPSMPHYPVSEESSKVPAAWLIEQAGWKGKGHEGVRTHEHHALVIINPEHKNATSVLAAAHAIQTQVKATFGITLEMEPQYIEAGGQ